MTTAAELTSLFTQLESRLAARISEALNPVVDAVLALQENQRVLVAAVNRLSDTTAELATRVRKLEATVSDLVRLTAIEDRVTALEARLATANDRG